MLKRLRSPYVWCFTLYFAEGLPYSIIRMLSSLFLRTMNVSLPTIGFTSLFSLPWIFKFFWAPFLDKYSSKKNWAILMQFGIGIIFFCLAISLWIPLNVSLIFILFFIGSFFAATNDIAIDGYYLEIFDKNEQSRFIGYRVMAYRIAMIFGTGAIATLGTNVGWSHAFILSSLLMILMGVFHFLYAPSTKTRFSFKEIIKINSRLFILSALFLCCLLTIILLEKFSLLKISFIISPIFGAIVGFFLLLFLITIYFLKNRIITYCKERFYFDAFVSFIEQDHIFLIIGFIVFLRAGEFLLSSMLSPFIVDIGLKNHYGWMQSFVGLPSSILGAIVGGYFISRYTLKKVAFPFLLAQNGTNLLYMIIAFSFEKFIAINTANPSPVSIGPVNHIVVLLVLAFDQFAGGLGTALLISILMKICKEEYRASHYAIGSGLMNITSFVTGISSGFLAKKFGYPFFFGISFLCSLPGMVFALLIITKLTTSKEF